MTQQNIKPKCIQVLRSCACGNFSVTPELLPFRWREFSKWRIRRRRDKATGLPFLLLELSPTEACSSCKPDQFFEDDYEYEEYEQEET